MSLKTIKDGVVALIASVASGDTVVKKVQEALAEQELQRRASILTKAFTTFGTLQKNFESVNKPDQIFTNGEGVKMEFFSEKRKGEINKAKSSLEKLETAVGNALGEGAKWDELEKHLQNAPKDASGSGNDDK